MLAEPAKSTRTEAEKAREEPEPTTEPWWTDARKALIAQGLAVLITPATVAMTLYLNEAYKKPRPRIEYTSATLDYVVVPPSEAVSKTIKENSRLSTMLTDELSRMSDKDGTLLRCAAWLDGRPWDSGCLGSYSIVTSKLEGELATLLQDTRTHRTVSPSLQPLLDIMAPSLSDLETNLTAARQVKAEFAKLASTEGPRSGGFEVEVGILNTGDSDGVVYDVALLKIAGKDIHISSGGGYQPVKAHGFEKVTFSTPWLDGEEIVGRVRQGEEQTVRWLSQEISKGKNLSFTIEITLSDKTASAEGSIS